MIAGSGRELKSEDTRSGIAVGVGEGVSGVPRSIKFEVDDAEGVYIAHGFLSEISEV
jgi:hypothetical protein